MSAERPVVVGGRGGIRTHEELAPLAVFKTAAVGRLATLPRGMDGKQAARTKRRDAGFWCMRRLGACATAWRVCDSFARVRQLCAYATGLRAYDSFILPRQSWRCPATPGRTKERRFTARAFAVRVREKLDGTDMAGAGGQYEAARGRCETDGQTFGPREAFGSGQTHRSSIGPRLTRKRAEAALRMARGLARGRIGNRPGGWPGNGSRMARARQGPPGLAKARPEPTRARPEPTRARPEPTRARPEPARDQPEIERLGGGAEWTSGGSCT